jgi:hypothetical protein
MQKSGNDNGDSELVLNLKKEITAYCKLQVIQQNVLGFWHQNQVNIPILYCIASIVLSTKVICVPSEKLFSDAGNNLYDKRNRMTSECFQMLMFLYENL